MMALSDEEAIALCRKPKPTPAEIKRVLTWAQKDPAPHKIGSLLVLQTGNYASRKGFDAAFHEVLEACARPDPSALWDVVEGDWDTYRVLHAVRALGRLGDEQIIQRLLDWGTQRVLRIHWKAILEAAQEAGVPVPASARTAQQTLETERGNGDFYDVFLVRKPDWPTERDQADPISKPASMQASKKPKPSFPDVFSAEDEPNPFLRTFKKQRSQRWTLTRMEGLFEEVDLAYYLTALGRIQEALTATSFLADEIHFTGNYNIWTPVGYAICLNARLQREAGCLEAAKAMEERIRTHPFEVVRSTAAIREQVALFNTELEVATQEDSKKWALQNLSRVLQNIGFYLTATAANLPHFDVVDVDKVEACWARGLDTLRQYLEEFS